MQTWINLSHYASKDLVINLLHFDIFEDLLELDISLLDAIFQSIKEEMTLNMNIL